MAALKYYYLLLGSNVFWAQASYISNNSKKERAKLFVVKSATQKYE